MFICCKNIIFALKQSFLKRNILFFIYKKHKKHCLFVAKILFNTKNFVFCKCFFYRKNNNISFKKYYLVQKTMFFAKNYNVFLNVTKRKQSKKNVVFTKHKKQPLPYF